MAGPHAESAEKDLAVLEQRIQEKLKPHTAQLILLDEIPGVDWTLAAVIIAEIGYSSGKPIFLLCRQQRLGCTLRRDC